MDSNLASVLSSLTGAVIGGLLTMWGAMKAVAQTARDAEAAEVRKERISCLVALCGLRFVIDPKSKLPLEWQARLMYELNKIPTLWCDADGVLNSLERYLGQSFT